MRLFFTHYILGIAFILLYITEDARARRRQTFVLEGESMDGLEGYTEMSLYQSLVTQYYVAYHFRSRPTEHACAADESEIGNIVVVQCGPETRGFARRLCLLAVAVASRSQAAKRHCWPCWPPAVVGLGLGVPTTIRDDPGEGRTGPHPGMAIGAGFSATPSRPRGGGRWRPMVDAGSR